MIESTQDTLLLGINWFKAFDARIYFDQDKLRVKIDSQTVESPIKCIEEAKPFFRILANTAENEEEEYVDEALYEIDLFQIKNDDDYSSDLNEGSDELECIKWPYQEEEIIALYSMDTEEET